MTLWEQVKFRRRCNEMIMRAGERARNATYNTKMVWPDVNKARHWHEQWADYCKHVRDLYAREGYEGPI